jgi:predicted DsbA family dithiol-disulfide isomerase
MRYPKTKLWLVSLVVPISVAVVTAEERHAPSGTPTSRPAATFAGGAVLESEVETRGLARLLPIRNQEYQTRRQVLDELLTKRLLELEATSRGLDVETLLKAEIDDKVVPPTDVEKRAQLEAGKDRYANVAEGEALKQIGETLTRQRTAERRRAFHAELRSRMGLEILIEPPRVAVESAGRPSVGPDTAPVTVVVFSDYQCPHCARFADTLLRLAAEQRDKVRLVFRDFPLVQIHKEAGTAAEAAACAAEQGKFLEMATEMFAAQSDLKPESLKRRAVALGLDGAAFDACLDSSRHAADWQRDVEDAKRLGVSGTPVAFVNGRFVSGARSYEAMVQLLEEEFAFAARATAGVTPQPGPQRASGPARSPGGRHD